MLSDRQTVVDGDTEHSDRCYAGYTWQHWWFTISSVATSTSEYEAQVNNKPKLVSGNGNTL